MPGLVPGMSAIGDAIPAAADANPHGFADDPYFFSAFSTSPLS
jgi:hypothetical protein